MESVQIPSFFLSVVPVFGLNTGKYGPEKTLYLDIFHAVGISRITETLSSIILKKGQKYFKKLVIPQHLKSMFGHFSRICMKWLKIYFIYLFIYLFAFPGLLTLSYPTY